MDKVIRFGCIVVIGCLTGLGGVWADQTLVDSLQQDAQALTNQVSADQSISDSAKSIKISKPAKKSTKSKSTKTKKATTKKPKKSKSKKSKKKARSAI